MYGFINNNSIVSIVAQTYASGTQEIDGVTLELIPELVTELPTTGNGGVTVNEDGTMTVNYQIRDEAVWSDGTPISGDDFAFTVDLLQTPEADAGFRIEVELRAGEESIPGVASGEGSLVGSALAKRSGKTWYTTDLATWTSIP